LGLLGVATLGAATVGSVMGAPTPARAASAGTVLPLVAQVPSPPDRSAFLPAEQVYASYLLIVADLANSIVDDDPALFGWIEDTWQQQPVVPFNGRTMEHVATLSWFVAHERTWNPYYLDPHLLARLDAALGYYLSIQNPNGSWAEKVAGESNLSPTSFGTVALSAALRDLQGAGLLAQRQGEIAATLRKSCAWLLDSTLLHWRPPVSAANQLAAGLAGVGQAATVLGDASIADGVAERAAFLLLHGQSPAGFFHEVKTFDFRYSHQVELPDLGHVYEQTGDPSVLEAARRFAKWLGYVVVFEPGEARGFIHGGICARTADGAFETTADDALDRAALGRVFLPVVPELARPTMRPPRTRPLPVRRGRHQPIQCNRDPGMTVPRACTCTCRMLRPVSAEPSETRPWPGSRTWLVPRSPISQREPGTSSSST